MGEHMQSLEQAVEEKRIETKAREKALDASLLVTEMNEVRIRDSSLSLGLEVTYKNKSSTDSINHLFGIYYIGYNGKRIVGLRFPELIVMNRADERQGWMTTEERRDCRVAERLYEKLKQAEMPLTWGESLLRMITFGKHPQRKEIEDNITEFKIKEAITSITKNYRQNFNLPSY